MPDPQPPGPVPGTAMPAAPAAPRLVGVERSLRPYLRSSAAVIAVSLLASALVAVAMSLLAHLAG